MIITCLLSAFGTVTAMASFVSTKVELHAPPLVRSAHATIEIVDLRPLSIVPATDFLSGSVKTTSDKRMWNKSLLSLVTTPQTLRRGVIPNRDELNKYGVPMSDLRPVADKIGIPPHKITDRLNEAYRAGMISLLHDDHSGMSYYGVPQDVRELFRIKPNAPMPVAKIVSVSAQSSMFGAALAALAAKAESLPPKDELFEFIAQTAAAAIARGLMKPDALSDAFRARSDAIGFLEPPLDSALQTLQDAAAGTSFEHEVSALLNYER